MSAHEWTQEAGQPHRCCASCRYAMASETAMTGLRCGLDYYRLPPLLRKFKTMSHYPIVRAYTLCESWLEKPPEALGQDGSADGLADDAAPSPVRGPSQGRPR